MKINNWLGIGFICLMQSKNVYKGEVYEMKELGENEDNGK